LKELSLKWWAREDSDTLGFLSAKRLPINEPVLINGPRSNAAIVGNEDWNSIQEALQLLAAPGMAESTREAWNAE
jgi:PHD/YefM family antitoxin component YafN of YafNO toxin-antitoxin module